jgi:hypothetical protein
VNVSDNYIWVLGFVGQALEDYYVGSRCMWMVSSQYKANHHGYVPIHTSSILHGALVGAAGSGRPKTQIPHTTCVTTAFHFLQNALEYIDFNTNFAVRSDALVVVCTT